MTEWKPIDSAPKDGRRISLVVQYADDSSQRIVPKCTYDASRGGSYYKEGAPEREYCLPDHSEFATHWSRPIAMPDAVSLYGDDQPDPPEGSDQ